MTSFENRRAEAQGRGRHRAYLDVESASYFDRRHTGGGVRPEVLTVDRERIGHGSGWTVEEDPGVAAQGGSGPRPAAVERLLERAVAWARRQPDIRGLALVGSWARGNARADSDVDLVVLTTGTHGVVREGLRILHDPDGRLAALAVAAADARP
jgi:Nucleotidyltransferase domain